MCYKKVELELYTAMNEYNKYDDNFNKVIINHIYNVVTERTEIFQNTLKKVYLDGVDVLLLKYSEISINCNQLLIDLNNKDKINNLKRSIEQLDILEKNIQKNANEIIEKLI